MAVGVDSRPPRFKAILASVCGLELKQVCLGVFFLLLLENLAF